MTAIQVLQDDQQAAVDWIESRYIFTSKRHGPRMSHTCDESPIAYPGSSYATHIFAIIDAQCSCDGYGDPERPAKPCREVKNRTNKLCDICSMYHVLDKDETPEQLHKQLKLVPLYLSQYDSLLEVE